MKKLVCTTLLVETSPQGLPLGVACIASAIKHSPLTCGKFDVSLVDYSMEDEDVAQALEAGGVEKCGGLLAEKLTGLKPDFVCFSVYVWNRQVLDQACRKLKEILPECVCIAGGPEVTADPNGFSYYDWTTAGQGENSTCLLLSQILDGKSGPIPGVYQKSDSAERQGAVVRSVPCPVEECVSPYLDGTIDVAKYGGALWELARGCPFKCSYCYESKGEKKIAYFPMERLEKELELFASKKISQVFVLDPTYNASKERALKILRLIQHKTDGMFFYFEARAEFIDRELARAFAQVPCCLQIGLQSADVEVLKNVHRSFDKKKFVKNIGLLNQEGVTFGFDLIYGLPGDSFRGFCESLDFAIEQYPNNLELFCLSVLPGTDLHDDAAGFGLEWQNQPPYHVLRTPKFTPEDLDRCARLARAVNLFYNQGRAVPWLNSVLYALHEKASVFFKDFALFLEAQMPDQFSDAAGNAMECELDSQEIQKLQIKFIEEKFAKKKISPLLDVAKDLIQIHGALGRCTFDGSESRFVTAYHPDDVMSEYGTDLEFFAMNAGKQKSKVHVFLTENGPDWETEK